MFKHSLFFGLMFSASAFDTVAAQSANSSAVCHSSYQVKVTTQTEFLFKQASVTRHKLSSFLSMKPLSNTLKNLPTKVKLADGATAKWWGLQLTDVQQLANQQAVPEELIYSLPFAVLRTSEGELIDFRFPVKVTPTDQDKLKGAAFYLQFPTGEQQVVAVPQRKESDTIGQYLVNYSTELTGTESSVANYLEQNKNSDEHLFVFEKSKQSYLDTSNVKSGQNVKTIIDKIDVVDSRQIITANSCWLQSTRGRESLKITSLGAGYNMETNQAYSVIKMPKLVDSLLWQLPDDFNLWHLRESEEVALTPAELKALALKMKQDLAALDLLQLRGSELGEWLKQFEPVIGQMAILIKSGMFNDQEKMRVFNALGQMDTPNGNQLLVDLMVDPELDGTDRFRAIRAITTGESALTAELKNALVDSLLSDDFPGEADLKSAAMMTLGAVIQRRTPNEESEELLTEITNSLSASSSERDQAALVASLGNSTRESVVSTLKTYSSSNSPYVRANVAASLGQVGNDDAHELLSGMLHSESDPKTQQAIIGAASRFELSEHDINKVANIAASSKSERTRGNAIKAIANQKHQSLLAQQQLKTLMKTEKSRKNFVLAAKSITALQNQAKSN
ncbi:MAG: HEAT repeat domain-containing protein [Gammaproteobacteria bacterium]|nr:HEAT repeat domain-containing protein [Gammaproteobacteria bacterium]